MAGYNLGTASGRIEIDGRAGAAGFKVVETAANTFFGVIEKKVDSIQAMGRRMQIAGAAGVAGFGIAIKAASNFEAQMSGVKAVAGGTEAEFESLRQKALQLGADTSFSASEAGLAIEELAKAGIPISDILSGAADATVALAAAGGVALPEAATIASNAMNQFGLSADEVVDVADTLAGVANTSAADVSTLGQSLSQAGAVANLAGLSFRDTAIALGEMADAGIQGSDAGTSLKTFLTNLIPTTDKQKNLFEELGLVQYDLAKSNKILAQEGLKQVKTTDAARESLSRYIDEIGKGKEGTARNRAEVEKLLLSNKAMDNQFFDQKGNIKDLGALQGVLAKALKNKTREEKLSTIETLFGADAMRASAILSIAGAKGYEEFSAAVSNTSAADVAKVRLDNLAGATEAFKGSMETAMITIGAVFLPVITKIVQGVTAIVNAFNNLPGPVKTGIAIIVGIVSALLILVGTLLASITAIAAFVLQWYALKIIRIATGYLIGFRKVMIGTTAAVKAQNAALATETVMERRVAAARLIAGRAAEANAAGTAVATKRTRAFIAVQKIAATTMLAFSRAAKAAWAALLGPIGLVILAVIALAAAGVYLYRNWEPFRKIVDQIASAIKGAFLSAWEALKPILITVGEYLLKIGRIIATDVLPILISAGRAIKSALGEAFKQISDTVKNDLMPALESLGGTFKKDLLPALQQLWTAIQPIAKIIGTVLVVAIVLAFKAFVAFAKFMIGTVYPILIKVFGFFAGTAISAITTFISGIADVISGVIKIFTGLINFFTGLFTGDWSQMWLGLQQIVSGAWSLIQGLFQTAFALLISIIQNFGSLVLGAFTSLFSGVDGATGGWISRIIGWIRTFVVTVLGIIRTGLMFILNVWRAAWNLFGPIIMGVLNIIYQVLRLAWTIIKGLFILGMRAVTTNFRAGWNALKAIVTGVLGVVVGVVRTNINMIMAVITAVWNVIKAITTSVWNAIRGVIDSVWGAIGGRVTNAVNTVQGLITKAWNIIKNATTTAFNAISTVVGDKLSEVISKITGLASDITGAVSGFGTLLYNAGAALISGLVEGITSKLEAVGDAISSVTDKVASFLPGSPVKEGPLTSWNRGGAGKRLIDLLAGGLEDTDPIDKAMRGIATYVNGTKLMIEPAIVAAPTSAPLAARPRPETSAGALKTRPARRKGEVAKKSRLVQGELHIGPDGRVWIEGIAQDVYNENEEFRENRNPKGGRRG